MKILRMILILTLLAGYWQVGVGADENNKTQGVLGYLSMPPQEVRKLADQGDADAQYYLGLMYSEGYGLPQNYSEAVKWWKLAAQKGGGYSFVNLGKAYETGRGVQQDYQEAINWWLKGAERGDVLSINKLATTYEVGFIVTEDKIQAHKWWNVASARGDIDATGRRNNLEEGMTPEQITEAQRLALEWME